MKTVISMVPSCIVFKNSSIKIIHMDNTGKTRSTAKQQSKTSAFQINNNNMSATRLVDYVIIMYYVNF